MPDRLAVILTLAGPDPGGPRREGCSCSGLILSKNLGQD